MESFFYQGFKAECWYDDTNAAFVGKVVNSDEAIQATAESYSKVKKALLSEIDALCAFNHGSGF